MAYLGGLLDKSLRAFLFGEYQFFFYFRYIHLLHHLIIRKYNFFLFFLILVIFWLFIKLKYPYSYINIYLFLSSSSIEVGIFWIPFSNFFTISIILLDIKLLLPFFFLSSHFSAHFHGIVYSFIILFIYQNLLSIF